MKYKSRLQRSTPLHVFALLGLIVSLAAACGKPVEGGQIDTPDLSGRTIKVVATTGQVGDAVENIGGDRVDVYTMMGPGIDPHLYKPTAGDVHKLVDADIIFYSGLHLEGRMADLFERLSSTIPTHALSETVPVEMLETPPEFEGNYDPHIWFDPEIWEHAVREVAVALTEIDPEHAATYEANLNSYLMQIDDLEAYAAERLAEVPEQSRVLVTAHDAFGYFGKRWGYEVRGLQGISTSTEAGAGDVQDLAEFLVERQIKAIFVETSVPSATIDAVIAAANARGWDISIGGSLYSDAMGDPGTEQGTYIGMYRHNVDTIVDALK